MVRDQYQVMGLVIPPKTYPHRPNVYSHSHVYSSLARSGQCSGNEIILPVTANLNFWSCAIFHMRSQKHENSKKKLEMKTAQEQRQ